MLARTIINFLFVNEHRHNNAANIHNKASRSWPVDIEASTFNLHKREEIHKKYIHT